MFAIGGIVQCDVLFVASPPMNLRIFFWSVTAVLDRFSIWLRYRRDLGIFSEHYSIVPACIFAFIAAHAVGQGAVIWVFISRDLS